MQYSRYSSLSIISPLTFSYPLRSALENGEKKWEKSGLLDEIENPWRNRPNAKPTIPALFKMLSGVPDTDMIHLGNSAIVDWMLGFKKKSLPKKVNDPPKSMKDVKWYQVSSQNRMIRDFFSHMNKNYDWMFTQSNLKGFEGCLAGVLKEMYRQRLLEFVSIFEFKNWSFLEQLALTLYFFIL